MDPKSEDLILRLVQLRDGVRRRQRSAEATGDRDLADALDAAQQAMKATANSTAYGSPIEMNPIEHGKRARVVVHLPDGGSYEPPPVSRTEQPGTWFHPLIATLVSAGGRLLLAAAMTLVKASGGEYAFCDTDSLFIVATKEGRLIPCPGGTHNTPNGEAAVHAIPWSTVEEISQQFVALNPYGTDASILEIESENFDDDGNQRAIECFAIASKRYALFQRSPDGHPVLLGRAGKLKRSEHGLGHLLSPHAPDPQRKDSTWLDEWWQSLLEIELGYKSSTPDWFDRAAVGRTNVGSPRELNAFRAHNNRRPYREQVKPWGFLVMAHPHAHERARADGPRCLVAPFERDPERREAMDWIDRDRPHESPRQIRTAGTYEIRPDSVAVLSYGDYFTDYRLHPEAKSLDPADRKPCHPWTRGLLEPQHIRAAKLLRIGKESNRLADTEQPTDEGELVIEYASSTQKCSGCEALVSGRRLWCSEACRKRAASRGSDAEWD